MREMANSVHAVLKLSWQHTFFTFEGKPIHLCLSHLSAFVGHFQKWHHKDLKSHVAYSTLDIKALTDSTYWPSSMLLKKTHLILLSHQTQMVEQMVQIWSNFDSDCTCPVSHLHVVLVPQARHLRCSFLMKFAVTSCFELLQPMEPCLFSPDILFLLWNIWHWG